MHAQLLSELELVTHRSSKDGDKTRDGGQGFLRYGVWNSKMDLPLRRSLPKTSPIPKTYPKSTGNRGTGGNDAEGSAKPMCFVLSWTQTDARRVMIALSRMTGPRSPQPRKDFAVRFVVQRGIVQQNAALVQRLRKRLSRSFRFAPQALRVRLRYLSLHLRLIGDAMLKSMLADAASMLHQTIPVATTEVPTSERSPASHAAPTTSGAGTGATPQAQSVTPGHARDD